MLHDLWANETFHTAVMTALYLLVASCLGWVSDKLTAKGGIWSTSAKPLTTLVDWLSANRAHK